MDKSQKIRNGRKFILTILLYSLIGLGYMATSFSPELVKTFEDFCETLVTILLVYCGGNVSNKWVNKGIEFPNNTKSETENKK